MGSSGNMDVTIGGTGFLEIDLSHQFAVLGIILDTEILLQYNFGKFTEHYVFMATKSLESPYANEFKGIRSDRSKSN